MARSGIYQPKTLELDGKGVLIRLEGADNLLIPFMH